MPELPEVEAARLTAEENLVGKTITKCDAVVDEKIFSGASPASLRSALVGKKVVAARRRGKHLWLELEGPPSSSSSSSCSSASSSGTAALLLHFGMTGSFPVRGAKRVAYVSDGGGKEEEGEGSSAPSWPPRFCKIELSLSPGDARVAYCDPRRFGRVEVVSPASDVASRLPTARDALEDPPSAGELAEALRKVSKGGGTGSGRAIKTVLLEQDDKKGVCCGVGNWVADEICFSAKVHPEALSGELSPAQVSRLARSIRDVVATAAVAARADASLFPREWIFHHRWDGQPGDSGKTSEGHRIAWMKVGGRTTAFCPGVQKKTDGGGGGGGKSGGGASGGSGGDDDDDEEEEGEEKAKTAKTAAKGKNKLQPVDASSTLAPPQKRGRAATMATAARATKRRSSSASAATASTAAGRKPPPAKRLKKPAAPAARRKTAATTTGRARAAPRI